jgi:hypothetical protein
MADSKNRQDKPQVPKQVPKSDQDRQRTDQSADQAKVGRGQQGGGAERPSKDRQDESRNKVGQQGAQDRKLDRDIKEQQDTEGGRQPQGMRPAPAGSGDVASDVDKGEDEDADEDAVTQRTPSQRDVVQPKK